MSHTRLCADCGYLLLKANVEQLVAHKGPNFQKWRLGMIRCAGGLVPDPPQSNH
jgi:hypothetical protein